MALRTAHSGFRAEQGCTGERKNRPEGMKRGEEENAGLCVAKREKGKKTEESADHRGRSCWLDRATWDLSRPEKLYRGKRGKAKMCSKRERELPKKQRKSGMFMGEAWGREHYYGGYRH